jgi:hypothetical protein
MWNISWKLNAVGKRMYMMNVNNIDVKKSVIQLGDK